MKPGLDLTTGEVCAALEAYVEPGPAVTYIRNHARRFQETLGLLPPSRALDVLDLGAFLPLTGLLRRITPHHYTLHACPGTPRAQEVECGGELFQVERFDLEQDPYPYGDGSFDLVLCAEVFEHLGLDPCHLLAEVNRILRPGGVLLLTTPNVVSVRSSVNVLLGRTPGFYPAFNLTRDRHNREYTPGEIGALLETAGFRAERLFTRDVYSSLLRLPGLMRAALGLARMLLAVLGSAGLRGDTIFALGRKRGPVASRYPPTFYDLDSGAPHGR